MLDGAEMGKGVWVGVGLLAAVALGLAIRLPGLGERPMHGDEANQAVKTGILFEQGEYRYDPQEHHGPTLYYLTLPALWLGGAEDFESSREAHYRIVPVLFGVGLILLLWPLRRYLGAAAVLMAAILTAVSPAFAFYSRYYIQEMLLVFFTFAAIVCGWRYLRNRRAAWAVGAGLALGLMHATKETAVLAYAAMAGGALCAVAMQGPRQTWSRLRGALLPRHLALLIAAGVGVSALFFSSFFTHPRGVLDSVLTYGAYLQRAGGAGMHDKPWHYYLQTLLYTKLPFGPRWSEGLILGLAAAGAAAAFAGKGMPAKGVALGRLLAVYTIILTALYALIPYKTPWCALSFLHGMILLAGLGAVALVRAARYLPLRAGVALLVALGTAQLAEQAHRACFAYASDLRNPYVYAHPVADVVELAERVEDLSRVAPEGRAILVRVIAPGGDYWPLPWYLRRFERVGYYDRVPEDVDGDVIIAHRELQAELEGRLKGQYQALYHGLRPNVILVVYVRQGLWDRFIESRS
jgi:uncharacterized protein (TIGR03663 family)